MKYTSIREHLRPYGIVARRRTTINHAFAAAVAPADTYDEAQVRAAIAALKQDPDAALECAYCGQAAETWDHVLATVLHSRFSGHGHRLGNLLPCCKPCNSKKGNKSWMQHLNSLGLEPHELRQRIDVIRAYLETYGVIDILPDHSTEYLELERIREQVMDLLRRADQIAAVVRAQTKARQDQAEASKLPPPH
jgi:hypothetical protein